MCAFHNRAFQVDQVSIYYSEEFALSKEVQFDSEITSKLSVVVFTSTCSDGRN